MYLQSFSQLMMVLNKAIIVLCVVASLYGGSFFFTGKEAHADERTILAKPCTVGVGIKERGDTPCVFTEKDLNTLNTNLTHTIQTKNAATSVPDSTIQDIQIAKERAHIMGILAEKDPEAYLANVIQGHIRVKLPAVVQNEVEELRDITGTIEVLQIDDFDDEEKSYFQHSLRVGGKKYSLKITGKAPALTSGSEITVKAYTAGETLVAAPGEGLGHIKVRKTPRPESVGVQNTLFILVTSPGLSIPRSKDKMSQMIFKGNFQNFYNEQSYGKVKFIGTVTDWITVPASDISSCGAPGIDHPDITAYIKKNNINLSQYGRIMFINNGTGGGCSFVGKTDHQVSGRSIRFSLGWSGTGGLDHEHDNLKMSFFEYVLIHEMGHQLGVMHANAWWCSSRSLDKDCDHVEYGNPYDVMGWGQKTTHFNAYYKDYLGWLDEKSKVTVTKSGPVSLSSLEAQKKGTSVALVKNPATPLVQPLYVEYRSPIGYDSGLPVTSSGLLLNQVIAPKDQLSSSRLINANHDRDYSHGAEQILKSGGTFSWPSHGISIGSVVTASTSTAFNVVLNTPKCRRNALKDTYHNSEPSVGVGEYGYVSLIINNQDTVACAPVTLMMDVSITDSAGWEIQQTPEKSELVTLAPGEDVYPYINFRSTADANPGARTLTITFTDKASGRTFTMSYPIEITTPPIIKSMQPTIGKAGSVVTISGSNFSTGEKTLNSILVHNDTYYAKIYNVYSSDGKTISFTFPKYVDSGYGKGAPGAIPTPDGIYYVSVIREDGGTSKESQFHVSSIIQSGIATSSLTAPAPIAPIAMAPSANVLTGGSNITGKCVDLWANMHRGAESGIVRNLQNFLIGKAILLSAATGFYGDYTVEAVKVYQGIAGLKQSGMVYELTRDAIRKETCIR